MARLYRSAVHRHHHPSGKVVRGDFADGAGRFHRQGAAGGVRVNGQTVVCRDALRASAIRASTLQVPFLNPVQIPQRVVLVADMVEEAENLLRHTGGTAVVVFRHLPHGGDVAVGHPVPIAGHRLPQLLQRHVVGVFAAGGLVGAEPLRQGGQQCAGGGQGALHAVHLRQLVGRHGDVARGGCGGRDGLVPFLQQGHIRHTVVQDVANFGTGKVAHCGRQVGHLIQEA